MALAAGVEKEQALRAGGFNDQEINQWKADTQAQLRGAGFGPTEVDQYFGGPDPSKATDLKPYVHGNLKEHGAANTPEDGSPAPALDFTHAFLAGLQGSSGGLIARNKLPDLQIAPDASLAMKIAQASGQMVGDIPAMWAGGVIGTGFGAGVGAGLTPEAAGAGAIPGAIVGGGAGAFALPSMLRRAYMDDLQKGAVKDFPDFFSRLAGVTYDGIKSGIVGAATVGVGGAAANVMERLGAGATTATLAKTGSELATMTTVGKAMEGEAPKPEDFLIGAATLAGFHGLSKTTGFAGTKFSKSVKDIQTKLQNTYADTGVKPAELVRAAETNPVLKQQLLAQGTDTPHVLSPASPELHGGLEMVAPDEIHNTLKPAVDYVRGQGFKTPEYEVNFHNDTPHVLDGERKGGAWSGDYVDFGTKVESAISRGDSFSMNILDHQGEIQGSIEYNSEAKTATVEMEGAGAPRPRVFRFEPSEPSPVATEMNESHATLNEPEFGYENPTRMILPPEPPEPPAPPSEPPGPGSSDKDIILSRIGEQGPKTEPKWDGFYTKVVDKLNPSSQWAKAVTGGKKLPAGEDPYAVVATAASRGYARADMALSGDGPVDFVTGKSLGQKSLKAILEPFKGDMTGFKAYLIARHSLHLESREIKTGVDLEASQRYVDENAHKYEDAMKEVVAFQNTGLDYLRDAGYLSKEQTQQIKDENPYYIPMRRVVEQGTGGGPSGSNPIRAIHGSERELIDPIESMIKNQFAYYRLAEQNAGKQAVIATAQKFKASEELIQKVATVSKPVTASDEEVTDWMAKNGIEGDPAHDLVLWRPMAIPLKDSEFMVMDNGKREIYSVDPSLAKALSATDYQDPSLLMSIASMVAKVQRFAVTENPFFLAIHAIRDQQTAYVQSQNHYRPVWDGLRGALHLMMGSEKADAFLRDGGGMSTMADFDKNYIKTDVWGLSKETGLLDKTWNVIKSPIEFQHWLAQTVFTAPKMGEYLRALEAGKDSDQAVWEARRVTSDVQQMGSSSFVRGWSAATPFFSMRIRGLDRMVESFKNDPVGTSARMTLAFTLPSMLNWIVNHKDERYKNAPNWEKDLYWVIPTGDTIVRIPKAFEPGLLFGSLVERTLNEAYEKDPGSFRAMDPNFFRALIGGVIPNVVPPILMPAMEQMANRSWLTGGNIVPHSLEGVSPAYHYNTYTTQTAQAIGKMIRYIPGAANVGHGNVTLDSPMVVENYVRAWSGNVGMYALQLADKALEAAHITDPAPVAPKSNNWVKNLADIPFVKSFFMRSPSGAAQPLQDFYDNFEKAKTRAATLQHLEKSGDMKGLATFTHSSAFQEHVVQMGRMEQAISRQGQLIKKIWALPMTADAKRQQIDGITYTMINTAIQGNRAMRDADAAMKGVRK